MTVTIGRGRLVLIALTVVALWLRLWGITFGLPFTQARPDEDAVAERAARMWVEGPNPHFFDYPTLYIYVVAAAVRVSSALGANRVDQVYLVDRLIVSLAGAATVPLLFWATRRLLSEAIALLAAALLSVAFLHVRDSHFGVTDVPATLMIVLAFGVIATRRLDWTRRWNALAAGVACGLAASTKYNAGIVIVPLLVASATEEWRRTQRISTIAGGTFVIIAGALAGFLAGTPYAWLDYPEFRRGVLAVGAHLAEGHGVDVGRGWWHHLTVSLWFGVGWPMLVAALVGVAVVAVDYRRQAALVLSFPLVYYAVVGSGQTAFARYATPLVPFACVLAAATVMWIAHRLAIGRIFSLAIVATSTAALVLPNVWRSVAFDRLIAREDNRLVAARALEAAFPSGATIYQLGSEYARLQLPAKFQVWKEDPAINVMEAPAAALPQLVVVPSSPLTLYTPVSDLAREVLRKRYRVMARFDVEAPGRAARAVYDEQDAFFLPMSGFGRLLRPGPTIEIYERTGK